MRSIDHTLKSHDERQHAPYQFHKDPHTTWKVQVPGVYKAHVKHLDGRVTEHTCGEHELPNGAVLLKMEPMEPMA